MQVCRFIPVPSRCRACKTASRDLVSYTMGRRPRIHYPGAIYHAIVRGNNRQPIFLSAQDRKVFANLVSEGIERFDHRIHAFCWMSNHVHLMVEVDQTPLSKIIHNLSFRYSGWFNRHQSRSGHLFERRYRAGLIETDRAAMGLVRYIHLNPVRAGMVQSPIQHRWTSHRAYLGTESVSWLETNLVLGLFSERKSTAIEKYKAFTYAGLQVDDGSEDQHRIDRLHDGCVTDQRQPKPEPGNSIFRSLSGLLRAVCDIQGVDIDALFGPSQKRDIADARALAAFCAREFSDLTITQVGRKIRRDPSTLSRAAERIARRMGEDQYLAGRVDQIRKIGQETGRPDDRPD